jgi:hypothetical protein
MVPEECHQNDADAIRALAATPDVSTPVGEQSKEKT